MLRGVQPLPRQLPSRLKLSVPLPSFCSTENRLLSAPGWTSPSSETHPCATPRSPDSRSAPSLIGPAIYNFYRQRSRPQTLSDQALGAQAHEKGRKEGWKLGTPRHEQPFKGKLSPCPWWPCFQRRRHRSASSATTILVATRATRVPTRTSLPNLLATSVSG